MKAGLPLVLSIVAMLTLAALTPATAEDTDNRTSIDLALGNGADAPYARFAVFYDINSNSVVRQKNIAKAKKVANGNYCFKLRKYKGKKVNAAEIMPNVTVDWYNSIGSDLLAFWESNAGGCKNNKNWFQIVTYDVGGNPSDNVSFVVTIP